MLDPDFSGATWTCVYCGAEITPYLKSGGYLCYYFMDSSGDVQCSDSMHWPGLDEYRRLVRH